MMRLAEKYGERPSVNHRMLAWVIRHSPWVITRYQVRDDGFTSYRKLKGRGYNSELVEIGECLWYKTPGVEFQKLDARWETGLFLGRVEASDEVLVGVGAEVNRARAIRRKPESMRWDKNVYLSFTAKPWGPKGQLRDRVSRNPPLYITKAKVATHGKTPGCRGCEEGGRDARHTPKCRERYKKIEERLRKEAEDRIPRSATVREQKPEGEDVVEEEEQKKKAAAQADDDSDDEPDPPGLAPADESEDEKKPPPLQRDDEEDVHNIATGAAKASKDVVQDESSDEEDELGDQRRSGPEPGGAVPVPPPLKRTRMLGRIATHLSAKKNARTSQVGRYRTSKFVKRIRGVSCSGYWTRNCRIPIWKSRT